MNKIITLSILTSFCAFGGGYKISTQSLNSLGLNDAYVAHTMGADTAYYNPAAMVYMEDKQYMEAAVNVIYVPSQIYTAGKYSGETETETVTFPTAFYVAKPIGNFRWGASIIVPSGATRRWETPYQKVSAEKFSLKNIEFNPAVAYKINDYFSVGAGLRFMYSQGEIYSDGGDIKEAKREMQGDAASVGYNAAFLLKLPRSINFAMTYRSQIDLKEEGEANLYVGSIGRQYDASLDIIHPAALNIGFSKTWNDSLTVEFKYERTYWSGYKSLDFEYDAAIPSKMVPKFDNPQIRDFKDTNTFRVGTTYQLDKLTLMAGFAIDESPISHENLGFELADSDAKIYSLGFRYQQTENLSWGLAFLYLEKEDFTLEKGVNSDELVLTHGGDFSNGGAYLTTLGVAYTF